MFPTKEGFSVLDLSFAANLARLDCAVDLGVEGAELAGVPELVPGGDLHAGGLLAGGQG